MNIDSMRTKKRAQTAASGSVAQKDFLSGLEDHVSPFKPPNEEQVFITREAEKQRKKEAKEANKHLKIWDKKTATSRMPLKRIKDEDVKPMQSEENLYNYNASTRGYISAAVNIAKSRVQFPAEGRPQNIDEFVNQKKEMFLVELSNNTIQEEIKSLELKNKRKKYALQDSSTALDQDNAKLIEFIEDDNMKRQEKMTEAENAKAKKQAADNEIRRLEQLIQNQKSDIDKNMELVKQFEDHKRFLFEIFATKNPKWAKEQELKKAQKIERIKQQWVNDAMMNPQNYEDEDKIMSDISQKHNDSKAPLGSSQQLGTSKRNKDTLPRIDKDEKDVEYRKRQFEALLETDDIDVPEDFYDEDILFEDPYDLMQIFEELQEINLDRIQKSQDNEHILELRKQQESKMMEKLDREIDTQETIYKDTQLNIQIALQVLAELKKENKTIAQQEQPNQINSQQKKAAQKESKKDEEAEVDIDFLMDDIRKEISRIYSICCDPIQLEAKPTIDILQEIELKLNDYMREIQFIHDHGEGFAKQVIKQVTARRDEWFTRKQLKIADERRKQNEALQKRMDDKRTKFKKKFGKPLNTRSDKLKLKKKQVEKIIDEDTQDQLLYLGLELKALPEQMVSSEEDR